MVAKKKKKLVKKTVAKKPVKSGKKAKKSVVKVRSSRGAKSVKKFQVKKASSPKKVAIAKTKKGKPVVLRLSSPKNEPTPSKLVRQKPMAQATYLAEEIAINEDNALTAPSKATTLLGALEFTPYQAKPGEAYMNEHQRVHFRGILDAWKRQLMQDVDATVGHLKEDAVFYADPVDRASQEEGFNLELRTRDRERRLIKKIEQSLDLINAGEYGFCEDCGAEIGIRRLEARPTAVKCIDCKTFQEIREKQVGS